MNLSSDWFEVTLGLNFKDLIQSNLISINFNGHKSGVYKGKPSI